MKINVFLATLTLCASNTLFAADLGLKDDVDPKAKEAIEAAFKTNQQVKEAGFEWIWANAIEGVWTKTKKLMSSTSVLSQAVEMANEGKTEEAITAANYIKDVAEVGLKQAALAPKAGPADYGL